MDTIENNELIIKKIYDEQTEHAITLLKLLLQYPDTKESKIRIGYMGEDDRDLPYSYLTMHDVEYTLTIWLNYQNVYFITASNEDGCEFSFTFLKPEHLEIIPLKIRTAMKELYDKHNPVIEKKGDLDYVYV